MKRTSIALLVLGLGLAGCDQMYRQASVRPYEQPQLRPTSGTVAVDAKAPMRSRAEAMLLKNPLDKTSETLAAGQLAYRRFCWPCHGPGFDGQSATVGPSLPSENLDLLSPRVVRQSDGELYYTVTNGSGISPPFEGVMTQAEHWEIITYIRDVQGKHQP